MRKIILQRIICIAIIFLSVEIVKAQVQSKQRKTQNKEVSKVQEENAGLDEFERLCSNIQRNPGGATEWDAIRLLRLAKENGQPYRANIALKSFVALQQQFSPEFLEELIENLYLIGDYRSAVSRSKAYLAIAEVNQNSSDIAARMIASLIDFLGAQDEAYRFMTSEGEKFRLSDRARKFDTWYVKEAQRRGDYVNLARRLTLVMEDKMELEKERFYFWPYLDWLMVQIKVPSNDKLNASSYCRKIADLIREDERRQLAMKFYSANLSFYVIVGSKSGEELIKEYESVIKAAEAYFSRYPDKHTMKDILEVFAAGNPEEGYKIAGELKRKFFADNFIKLTAADREDIMSWEFAGRRMSYYVATPEQWTDIALSSPEFFKKSAATKYIPFLSIGKSKDYFVKQASFLEGVPSSDAAVINSIAAGNSVEECISYFMRKESWHFSSFDEIHEVVLRKLWPAFEKINSGKISYDNFMMIAGKEYVAKTPAGLSSGALREYIQSAWRFLSDKTEIVKVLAGISWIPVCSRDKNIQRNKLFEATYRDFKQWAENIRKDYQTVKKDLDNLQRKYPAGRTPEQQKQMDDLKARLLQLEKASGSIIAMEDAFKKVLDPQTGDPQLAPNEYCKYVAELVLAADLRDKDKFIETARKIYRMIRDYDVNKVPCGMAVMKVILAPGYDMELVDLQCEILKDQLNDWKKNEVKDRIRFVADTIMSSRRDFGWFYSRKQYKDIALKFNRIFADKLAELVAENNFDKELFTWVRGTRRGSEWIDFSANSDLMISIIEKNMLPVIEAMELVRNEWRLPLKYNVEEYFDDMYASEIMQTKKMDLRYWALGGQDKQNKVKNAAARVIAGFSEIPVGYGGSEKLFGSIDDFMQWQVYALGASPSERNAMLDKIESLYGSKRYDRIAMGTETLRLRVDAKSPNSRKEFFDRLSLFVERVVKIPSRLTPPSVMMLKDICSPSQLSIEELSLLRRLFDIECSPPVWLRGYGFEILCEYVYKGFIEKHRIDLLLGAIPEFWRIGSDTANTDFIKELINWCDNAAKEKLWELSAIFSGTGIDFYTAKLDPLNRSTLTMTKARSLANFEGFIPVPPTDPRYPIYAAQAFFLSGNPDRAWEKYNEAPDLALRLFTEMDPSFYIWLIRRNTEGNYFDRATALARTMIQWAEEHPDIYSKDIRLELMLAYADIAFGQQEYPRAKALYTQIASAQEFEGLKGKIDAEIKIADIDRITGQYDAAKERLENLLKKSDRYIQTEANYALSLVYYDQKDYDMALETLKKVFSINPSHSLGRILEAKINIDKRQIDKALRVRNVGLTAEQERLVPGKPLHLSVEDRNLAIVGKTADIPIKIWNDYGDEEILKLRPFADDMTRFEGEIPTTLAPIQKGDGVLQVLGQDKVYYDFEDSFKKAHDIREKVEHVLKVVSDAELYASSGKIKTKEEIEQEAVEAMIRAKLQIRETKQEGVSVPLSEIRAGNNVKPGNAINVRVVDPDMSITPKKDKVYVKVTVPSGDSISAFPLEETDTHSGVFEGKIQTSKSPAAAFASDSDEGSNPNYVISSGDYPAWVGRSDGMRPKIFTVDLNDSRTFNEMNIKAGVPGRRLKEFIVQVSMNNKYFNTVAGYPVQFEMWDGYPMIEIVKYEKKKDNKTALTSVDISRMAIEDLQQIIEDTSLAGRKRMRVDSLKLQWGKDVFGSAGPLKINEGDIYIAHFKAAFYVPVRTYKKFRFISKGDELVEVSGRAIVTTSFKFFIDNIPVEPQYEGTGREMRIIGPPEFGGYFRKGVHFIDIYIVSQPKDNVGFELLTDIPEPPYMTTCSIDMFDPKKTPEIFTGINKIGGKVECADNGNSFIIKFNESTIGRSFRLIIYDFETDAPAIEKIGLILAGGEKFLPVAVDLIELRKNQILEVIPGDTITVMYKNDIGVERDGVILETKLNVTYTDGSIDAGLVVGYEAKSDGSRMPVLARLYRYEVGDTIEVTIRDPDLDVSEKEDSVEFMVEIFGKPAKKFVAVETGNNTGVFTGRIFPVNHEPKRDSEIKVEEGDDLIIFYVDTENLNPGIPWKRTVLIDQNWYQEPELRVYSTECILLTNVAVRTRTPQVTSGKKSEGGEESIKPEFGLIAVRPASAISNEVVEAVVGGPVLVELIWPTIARSSASKATIYAQTKYGRSLFTAQMQTPFDLNIPGTIRISSPIGRSPFINLPPCYASCQIVGSTLIGQNAAELGMFMFNVPVEAGALPSESLVKISSDIENAPPQILKIKGNDEVYIGFQYKDKEGKEKWITKTVKLVPGGAIIDVMDKDYKEFVTGTHVGKKVYLRVIDPSRDVSDDRDKINVQVVSDSGHSNMVELIETYSHSGIFKGTLKFIHVKNVTTNIPPEELPVTYGATVTCLYRPREDMNYLSKQIEIYKGADGDIQPFTKRFKDPTIAVRTQLAIAEAYFELAKEHRKLNQKELSKFDINEGKRILEEAVKQFPDDDTKAQAEYLLANLSMELGDEEESITNKMNYYKEAEVRFRDIVVTYPNSSYAPKAQYKRALALEKMGDFDAACEEYVKLSYRYPDNELVAETIARLGQYFYVKGRAMANKADEIKDPVEKEKIMIKARELFSIAGEVFSRLRVRFPAHELALKATLMSGQCYMRAEDYKKAIEQFRYITDNKDADKDVRAEAMYWCGDSYVKLGGENGLMEAYRMFKNLTWDYPASKWAKAARGRLAEEQFARIDKE